MTNVTQDRIYLSPPHIAGRERELLLDAFDSNWIAPLGPHVEQFEHEFSQSVGARFAIALSSGTAALHLALLTQGVGAGDAVLCSSLTFVATANAVCYCGAQPVFIDSEWQSWNLDPELLEAELVRMDQAGKLPAAVVSVDLFGQCADYTRIVPLCKRFGVPLIVDAAESLGATCDGRSAGTQGVIGCFSLNGNKIITASGGGVLVTDDPDIAARVRLLATQAKLPAPHYEHEEVGYNYRLSNLLAAVARGQLETLSDKVAARRANFNSYQEALGGLPGVEFMPEASYGRSNRWLTCMLFNPNESGTTQVQVRDALAKQNIESRPIWKPMHLQPAFSDCRTVRGNVAEDLFERGLCLPSGSSLTPGQLQRVVGVVSQCISTERQVA